MEEIWKAVPSEYKLYKVSNFGNIQVFYNGAWTSKQTKITKEGYMVARVSRHKKKVELRIHRLVAEAFIPNPNNKPYINHKDGNRCNNHVDNLEWVTPLENTHHAMRRGKYAVKLHPEQITQIRKLHSEGHNQVQLGKKFGVTNGMICHIIKGRKWSWIS